MVVDLYDIRKKLLDGKTLYDIELNVTWYSRVSTDKEEQLHSLQNQITYYTQFINKVPKWHYVEGYYDEGISGKSAEKREGFLKMINDGINGKFNLIITKELSRFARNTVESIKYTRELLKNNVGVLFETDAINTFLPDMDFKLTIMSGMAQDELRKISERVKFGFKRSIDKGVVLGNDLIWGYKKDKGKLVVVEEEAEIIRKIFDMYANKNLGFRAIGRKLAEEGILNNNFNNFSYSTLSKIITNYKYKGYYCGHKTEKVDYMLEKIKKIDKKDWVIYQDFENVPPIVSESLWNKANYIYNIKSKKNKMPNLVYTGRYSYSSKIICGVHNTFYQRTVYKYKNNEKELWECREYKNNGIKGCNTVHLYTYELNQIIKKLYDMIITNKKGIVQDIIDMYKKLYNENEYDKVILKYKNINSDIMKKKDLLLDLLLKEKLSESEFESRNNKFNNQYMEYDEKIKKLELEKSKLKNEFDYDKLSLCISNEINFNDGFSNYILDNLIEKIIVNRVDDKIILDIYLKIISKKYTCIVFKDKRKFSFEFLID